MPLIKDICVDKHPPPIISTGNSLTISVYKNDSYHAFIFKAYYSTLDNSELEEITVKLFHKC